MTTMTSREFNQDLARAKRIAREEPVFITARGKSDLVLLSHDDYERLVGNTRTILDALRSAGVEKLDIDLVEMSGSWRSGSP